MTDGVMELDVLRYVAGGGGGIGAMIAGAWLHRTFFRKQSDNDPELSRIIREIHSANEEHIRASDTASASAISLLSRINDNLNRLVGLAEGLRVNKNLVP